MYNRDRRISSIISSLDDLSDIDTRAADELRAVHHEHSITAFLEGHSPAAEDLHDCQSPLEHEATDGNRAMETAAPGQPPQTVAHEAPTPKAPVLSAPHPRNHQRRGTVGNGATSRRSRDLDSPPPSPIIPVFFGNSPKLKSPSLQRAPDSADSIDRLDEAVLAAKSKE